MSGCESMSASKEPSTGRGCRLFAPLQMQQIPIKLVRWQDGEQQYGTREAGRILSAPWCGAVGATSRNLETGGGESLPTEARPSSIFIALSVSPARVYCIRSQGCLGNYHKASNSTRHGDAQRSNAKSGRASRDRIGSQLTRLQHQAKRRLHAHV